MKFLHTADWQIGAAFRQVPGDAGARLRAARLEVIERIGQVARDESVQFVLVAGDVFDHHAVSERVVAEACAKISRWPVPVYLIPGNHDYGEGVESVYQGRAWNQNRPPNTHLLLDTQPVVVAAGQALILPCPMLQRRVFHDPTAHLVPQLGRDLVPDAVRIGLAHGTVVGFESQDEEETPNLIDPKVVRRASLDYLALGDWHGVHQVNERAFYSGTPEPDRFKDNRPGHVLVVEIAGPGELPQVKEISTAAYAWTSREARLHTAEDVQALGTWLAEASQPDHTLLRLHAEGALNLQLHRQCGDLLQQARERFFHLREEGPGVLASPDDEEIQRLSGDPIVGRVVARLRGVIASGADEATAAQVALQLLYQWIMNPQGGAQ